MSGIRGHYRRISRNTAEIAPPDLAAVPSPIVVLPMERWTRLEEKALRFAYSISHEIVVLHIVTEHEPKPEKADLKKAWGEFVEKPARTAGLKPPKLVLLRSAYRMVVMPIYKQVLQIEQENPDRYVAVLVPELVEPRWYYYLLHGQRATALKLILYRKGDRRTIVVNVPWYLEG